jgi:MFS family permease
MGPLLRDLSESERALVIAFYLPSALFATSRGMLLPILPLFAAELTDSYVWIGVMLAAAGIGMLLADVPSGFVLRRFGSKRTMLIGLAITILAMLGLSLVQSVFWAIVSRLLMGVGLAFFGLARHNFIASAVDNRHRGRAISTFGGVMRIGVFIGPAIGGLLAAAIGFRGVFLINVTITLAVAALIALYLRDVPAATEADEPTKGGTFAGWPALRPLRGILLVAGTGQLLAQMVRVGRSTVIPLYAAAILGLDVAVIGLITSIGAMVDMSLFYVAGSIMDRHGRKWAIVPSFAIQGLGMLMIPFTASALGLAAASVLIGLGNGLGAGTMMTLGSDLAPARARSEFLSVWRLIGDSCAAAGPILVGIVAQVLVLPAAAVVVAMAGFGAAGVFAFFVPETLARRRAPGADAAD